MASFGWFLAILGKMADSKDRGTRQDVGILLTWIDAQCSTFVGKFKSFCMKVKI